MAYKNLVMQPCVDKVEFFCRLRDFLCARNGTYDYSASGIGWSLHDSSYAVDEDNPQLGDWFVVYSPGESGREDLYYRFDWENAYLNVTGHLYWDSTSHVGVTPYSTQNNFTVYESVALELSLWGDLDFVTLCESVGHASYDYIHFFGKTANSVYDDSVAIAASAYSSGSDVQIALDTVPTSWQVGGAIFIRDTASVKRVVIKAMDASSVTVDLPVAFAVGSKLSQVLGYVCNSSSTAMGCYGLVGQSVDTPTSLITISYGSLTNLDPDGEGNYLGGPIVVQTADNFLGHLPHLFMINYGSLLPMDALTASGESARYLKYYTNIYLAVKEV